MQHKIFKLRSVICGQLHNKRRRFALQRRVSHQKYAQYRRTDTQKIHSVCYYVGIAYADPYCNGKTVFKNGCYMAVVSMIVCALLIYPIANLVS